MIKFLRRNQLVLIFLIFLGLLIFRINAVRLFIWDEAIYANSVQSLVFQSVDANNHPLLAKTIWLIFVKLSWLVLGTDYPFFWRIGTIGMAIGTVFTFYKILRLFFQKEIAILCLPLLMFDPMFFVFSRTVHLEVPSLLFFLISVYSLLVFHNTKKTKYLYVSAFTLGLCFAVKISPVIAFIGLIVASSLNKKNILSTAKKIIIIFLMTSLAYTVGNGIYFVSHHFGNFITHNITLIGTFLGGRHKEVLAYPVEQSAPYTWFAVPQVSHMYKIFAPDGVVSVVPTQNPVTMFLLLPCLVFLIFKWKQLDNNKKIIIYTFTMLYGIYFINIRETYYYYIVQLLPFIILIELMAAQMFFKSVQELKGKLKIAVLISLAVFILFYPIITGFPTPKKYAKMLEHYSIYQPTHRNIANCQEC